MDSSKPTKQKLRDRLQQARLGLDPEDRREKAKSISEKLLQEVNWAANPKVHCFEPIMRLGEVDLVDFVVALQTDETDIEVFTSRKFGDEWKVVSADTDLPAPNQKFDAIIVPMLGFDPKTLHRVGYGGGYYDRFLADHPEAKKIGVCYELGNSENLPNETHDVPLEMIVTEKAVYRMRVAK